LSWRPDANSERHRKHKRPSSSSESDRPCEALASPLADSAPPGGSPCGFRREANHGQIHPQPWQYLSISSTGKMSSPGLRNLSGRSRLRTGKSSCNSQADWSGPGCRSAHAPAIGRELVVRTSSGELLAIAVVGRPSVPSRPLSGRRRGQSVCGSGPISSPASESPRQGHDEVRVTAEGKRCKT
jgi:hypothetical protein